MTPTIAYARVRHSIKPHTGLLTNSSSLIGTSLITSVFGFVFWWVAARGASPTAVGQASAAVSAMTLIGTIAMFGLGTLLISELPTMTKGRWRLISACLVVASAVGLIGALIYVTVSAFVPGLAPMVSSPIAIIVIIVGVVVSVATLVLDDSLIGLLAGPVQLVRNAYFSAGKLALLGLCVIAPITVTATEILGTWVVAAVVSLIAVVVSVRARGLAGSLRPNFGHLRSIRRRAMDHNLLNLALYLPRLALPLVVTVTISAQANAGFYAAWMIISVLGMIPNHFATALFAEASKDVAVLRSKVNVALLASLGIGVPASIFVAVERDRIMAIFGPGYVSLGATALGILAVTYVPSVVRALYIAISRATGRIRHASGLALGMGVVEVAAAVIGGATGGLTRLAIVLAAVFFAEGAIMAPAVWRVSRRRSAAG